MKWWETERESKRGRKGHGGRNRCSFAGPARQMEWQQRGHLGNSPKHSRIFVYLLVANFSLLCGVRL